MKFIRLIKNFLERIRSCRKTLTYGKTNHLSQGFKFVCVKIIDSINKLFESIKFLLSREKVLLNVWGICSNSQAMPLNFGDDLNFFIFKILSNRKPCFNYSSLLPFLIKDKENILGIGSIIESHVNKDSIIWGSGAMYGDVDLKQKPKKVLAVRGPLTRKYLCAQGVSCPEVYGDPALLLPFLYKKKKHRPKYKLGVIPHFKDFDSKYLLNLRNDPNVKLIRVKWYQKLEYVIDEICDCEFIVSSSLHGLIVADAYNIPNLWVKFSDNIEGGFFKYFDYFMSVGRKDREPVVVTNAILKEDLLKYKDMYTPIKYDPRILIENSPFGKDIPECFKM